MSYWSGHRENQSKAHAQLMQMAMARFSNMASLRGMRAVEEIAVGKAVLDVLALFYPQGRIWDRLTEGEPRPQPRKEYWGWSRPEVEKPTFLWAAFVVEAKATRADFMRIVNEQEYREAREVGNFHYLATEKGVAATEEIPAPWGLLERRGRGLRELKRAKYVRIGEGELANLAETMLWSRDSWHRRMVMPRAAMGRVWDALMGVT